MAIIPPPQDDDDIDDETLSAFEKVLKKYHGKNPEWLRTLFPDFSLKDTKPPAADLTTFLQSLLAEQKETGSTLSTKLEAALSLMTPEQLIQYRSQNSASGNAGRKKGVDGQPNGEPPMKPDDPPTPAKKPRKWL
jgi:hypothetical protein